MLGAPSAPKQCPNDYRTPIWVRIPTIGYMTGQQAQRDISQYLMHHYNWIRPHQFNDGLAPAKTEEKLKTVSSIS